MGYLRSEKMGWKRMFRCLIIALVLVGCVFFPFLAFNQDLMTDIAKGVEVIAIILTLCYTCFGRILFMDNNLLNCLIYKKGEITRAEMVGLIEPLKGK